jgi:GMP synthase-like glutamine amidotransferase
MILVVDMNWKRCSLGYFEFVQPILEVAQKLDQCIVKHWLDLEEPDIDVCNGVILSGTALKDVETLGNLERFQWLKTTNKPVLGICAGMETIGAVYGTQLEPSLEIGMTQVKTVKDNPLAQGNFRAYSLHSIGVGSSDMFEVWAKSEKCNQIIKHKTKPLFGVLFHPEVRNPQIIDRFWQISKNTKR